MALDTVLTPPSESPSPLDCVGGFLRGRGLTPRLLLLALVLAECALSPSESSRAAEPSCTERLRGGARWSPPLLPANALLVALETNDAEVSSSESRCRKPS